MATWTNQNKSSLSNLTWNDATFSWDSATEQTWDNVSYPFSNQTKNSSSWANGTKDTSTFVNQTKN